MSPGAMTAPSGPIWDYVVFAGLVALSLGTGLYLSLRRRSRLRSKDETFLGSRTIHTLPLGLSMVASNVTASGLIAFTAHYYVYGFHTLWVIPAFLPAVLMVAYLFLPVLYELRVTSIFEYLRMRYGNGVGVASSVIYFVLSQAIGVTGLYSAAVATSTVFGVSTVAATVIIGASGTAYTALGGLRSVVWADCIQTLIMTASPLVIIAKIAYDSSGRNVSASSRGKLDVAAYIFRTDLDLTTDETVWAALVAAFPYQLLRLGLDQMITQRFLAARSLHEARTVTFIGAGLLALFYALGGFTALAIVLWFRDCDPFLSGSISRYDQMVTSLTTQWLRSGLSVPHCVNPALWPFLYLCDTKESVPHVILLCLCTSQQRSMIVPYYINKSARAVDGVRGLFLAGVVSASISTISSIVNSQAAVLYVDIVSPKVRVAEKTTPFVLAGLAATSGTVMTLFGLAVPYAGSAARFCISLYASASGPFAGIMILAFLFPWANARGTATAALAVFLVQLWQTTGRFLSRIEPRRMNYSVERCPVNSTLQETDSSGGSFEVSEVFPLYRLSPYWCCMLSACSTVLLGLVFSLLLARPHDSLRNAARLSAPAMLKFWQRIGLLQRFGKEDAHVRVIDPHFKVSPFELQHLQEREGDHGVLVDATNEESSVIYKSTPLPT